MRYKDKSQQHHIGFKRYSIDSICVCFFIYVTFYIYSVLLQSYPQVDASTRFSSEKNDGWISPKLYKVGDHVDLVVGEATREDNSSPRPYYKLPFVCPPKDSQKPIFNSFTDLIEGKYLFDSEFKLKFAEDEPCQIQCSHIVHKKELKTAYDMVKNDFITKFYLKDGFPVGTTYISGSDNKKQYLPGFALGQYDNNTGEAYLHTHLMFVIRYNAVNQNTFTIVGVEVYPSSLNSFKCPGASSDYEPYEIVIPEDNAEKTIPFSYSVYWREEFDLAWSQRWAQFTTLDSMMDNRDPNFNITKLARLDFLLILFIPLCLGNALLYSLRKSSRRSIFACSVIPGSMNGSKDQYSIVLKILIACGAQFFFLLLSFIPVYFSLTKYHQLHYEIFFSFLALMSGVVLSIFICLGLENNVAFMKYNHIIIRSVMYGSALPAFLCLISITFNKLIQYIVETKVFPFKQTNYLFCAYLTLSLPLSILVGSNYSHLKTNATNKGFGLEKSTIPIKMSSKNKMTTKCRFSKIFYLLIITGFVPFSTLCLMFNVIRETIWKLNASLKDLSLLVLFFSQLFTALVLYVSFQTNWFFSLPSRAEKLQMNKKWRNFVIGGSSGLYLEFYIIFHVFIRHQTFPLSFKIIALFYLSLFNFLLSCSLGALNILMSGCLMKLQYNDVKNEND